MGVSKAPDIATEIMHEIFMDMTHVKFYMHDIGCFSTLWKDHMALLEEVQYPLESVRFTINPMGSFRNLTSSDTGLPLQELSHGRKRLMPYCA